MIMTLSSLLVVSLCAALTLQSVCSFVIAPQKSIHRSHYCTLSLFGRGAKEAHHSEHLRVHGTPKITEVHKMDDFLKFLGEDDRLCVVKFHASWCKSCQMFGVKFRKLGMEVADVWDGDELVQSGPVRMASVEFGANTSLCRALGIKKLPYIHIYKCPVGRIADFSCGPSKFSMLEEKLAGYINMSNEELKFEKEMDKGGELGDVIVSELKQIHKEQQDWREIIRP